jgi:hypothetical protein
MADDVSEFVTALFSVQYVTVSFPMGLSIFYQVQIGFETSQLLIQLAVRSCHWVAARAASTSLY